MKTSFARVLCLALALMMAVTLLAACDTGNNPTRTNVSDVTSVDDVSSEAEPVMVVVDDDDPYEIAKDADGKDVVILVPGEDDTVIMQVAADTTVEQFLALVTAKEGFSIKLTDKDGKEVTVKADKIEKGMVFAVYEGDAEEAKVTMTIDVVSEEEIEAIVEQAIQQETASKATSKPATSTANPGSKPAPTSSPSSKPSGGSAQTVTLSSIWGSHYTASDAEGKAWQSGLSTIEQKYNIKTTVLAPLDPNSATDTIVKEVMAGKASADVFDISLVMCRNVARKKAAANLYDSSTLNKSLYNTGATKSVTFGGKVYGVAFASKSTNPMGVIYNKDLIAKYAGEYDIPALYASKKWDFDAFRAIAKACTLDTDGNGKTDVYGFTSNTNIIGMALTANAGGTALMVNGRVEATMCNDSGIAALEWCKTLYKTDKSWRYFANITDSVSYFTSGQAAMFVSYLHYYPTIASQANFGFGFVLMPIGPDQKEYFNGQYDASLYVVPKTKEARLDVIGNWLNGLATASNKLINIKVQDMARNGLDTTSQNTYKWVVNNMTPEFSSGAFSGDISTAVDGSVTSASKSPAKVMASIKSQAQKELDDYYAPLY